MNSKIQPTSQELFFPDDGIIVSKTDLKGRLTYVNETFYEIANYDEADLLGQPHSIIRHPDMPRAVFKLLWDALDQGREVFAYVKNMARTGSYYWVLAHVTPSYSAAGEVVGFHSNRRVPRRDVLEGTIIPLYSTILQEERKHKNGQQELAAGTQVLSQFLQAKGTTYDAFIFSL
jgi:PAS domain S-box-containing protein